MSPVYFLLAALAWYVVCEFAREKLAYSKRKWVQLISFWIGILQGFVAAALAVIGLFLSLRS
jgi:hypothetical protein